MFPFLIIGLLVLGVLAGCALVWRMAVWRLGLPRFEPLSVQEFPSERLELLRAKARELEEHGMNYAGLQVEKRGVGKEWWQALFQSADGETWAVVECAQGEDPRLVLHTFLAEGRGVTTSCGEYADYDVTDDWRLTEQRWERFEEQAKAHRQKVLGAGSRVLKPATQEEFVARSREVVEVQFRHLSEVGFLVEEDGKEGCYRVQPWKQPSIALRMLLHSLRNRLAERNRKMDAEYQERLQEERDERARYAGIAEYKYLEFYKEDKKRSSSIETLGWSKAGAFLFFSLVALLVLFYAQGVLDERALLVIGGVILVHELGHVAMMCLFGYRDPLVVFVPGLARLAPRKNMRVSSFREFLVLLMGPLPGLLVGWGLLVWSFLDPNLPGLWREIGFWAAVFNTANFLPVLPCDGGRVVNLLVFERVPALRLVYLIFSALSVLVSVLVVWLVTHTFAWPVLVGLVSTLVAIPGNWRHAKMGPWAKLNLSPEDSEYDALIKAFQIVERTDSTRGLEKRGWTSFVERVVRYGCAQKLGVVGTLACLVLFFSFLATPLVVVGILAVGDEARLGKSRVEVEARLADMGTYGRSNRKPLGTTTRESLDAMLGLYQAAALEASLQGMTGPWQEPGEDRIAAGGEDRKVELARVIDWYEAVEWLEEEEVVEREETVAYAVGTLIASARQQLDGGEDGGALTDLTKAWWALTACEPRTSLGVWMDWLHLEEVLFREVERLSSTDRLPARTALWFAGSLEKGAAPVARKLARLLLLDLRAPGSGMPGGGTLGLAEFQATPRDVSGGFRLRRSHVDQGLSRNEEPREARPDLGSVIDGLRVVRGLPTVADLRIGMEVVERWDRSGSVGGALDGELGLADQHRRWEARIAAIYRHLEFRKLVGRALEMEGRRGPSGPVLPASARGGRFEPVKMEGTYNQWILKTRAPDGSELTWRLSGQPVH